MKIYYSAPATVRAPSLSARLLQGAAIAVMLASSAGIAHAQQTAPADEAPAELGQFDALTGDIVVNGRRQRDALSEERESSGVTDVVTTGDVAIMSQTSIADLGKQLPGVSLSRDQGRNQSATGEGQFLTIRGFDAGFNAYTLDGLRLPQTSGSSRAISLNLFSPFAIGAIATDKTPGAAKDSDSIAGIVDLRTPTAFDFSANFVRARVLAQAAQLALDQGEKGWGGAVGIDAARRFGSDNQFGVYVAGYYEKRDNGAESTAVQNDYKTTNVGVGTARANGNALSADGVQWNFFNNEIERYGVTGSLDFQQDAIELYARLNYAVFNNTNTMNQTALRNELTSGQVNPNPNPNRNGNRSYNAAGVYTPIGINPASYFRTEDVEQELLSAHIGGKLHWDNGLYASFDAAYADGRFDQPSRIEAAFRGIAYNGAAGNAGLATEGVTVDLSQRKSPRPVLSAGATTYVGSLDRPTQLYVQSGYDFLSETKKTLRGALGWKGDGALAAIEIGGQYEDSDRSGRSLAPDDTRYRFRTPLQAGTVDGISIAQYGGMVIDSFLDYYPARPIKLLSRKQMNAQVKQFVPTIAVSQNTLNRGLLTADETRLAVYASATLRFGDVEIIPGIRYEDNSFSARYFLSDADGARFVNAGRDYSHVDPSLLATWRPDDRFVVRGAVRSSYARPSFDQIAGPTRISRDPVTNAILSITQPNPDLQPVEAWSYDLGVEYYGDVGRYLQLAAYHKDLSNILVPSGTRVASETIDGIVYNRTANGGEGSATGIELSGRFTFGAEGSTGLFANFGIGGNVTLQRTRAEYRISPTDLRRSTLPMAPNLIYNAELFYAKGPLRSTLWYNWTGRFIATVQDSQPDIYVQPVGELNFGLAYQFSPNFEVGVSARNLLDQQAYWATVGKSGKYISNDRNGGFLETGRVFQVSLTAKM